MALYPCDQGNHRYLGKQQTVYPALVSHGEAERRKLRLCPQHMVDYLDDASQLLRDAYDDTAPNTCCVCHSDQVEAQIFLTFYANGQERQDLFGNTCEAHRAQLRSSLKIVS